MALNTGIAHKNLTDPQLHEPKGAATAEEGSIIVAKGDGSTEWKNLPEDLLSFSKQAVAKIPDRAQTTTPKIDTLGLSAVTDGKCTDSQDFTNTNKNIKELAIKLNKALDIIAELQEETQVIRNFTNTAIDALKEANIIRTL